MPVQHFRLPDPGEGLIEAEIVTWRVAQGDTVKVNDIVVEIETAKSLVELPVPFAGLVTELLVNEGDTVEVGTPIISVETAPGAPTTVQDAPSQGAVEPGIEGSPAPKVDPSVTGARTDEIEEGKIGGTTSTGRTAVLVGYGVKQTEAKRRPRKAGRRARALPDAQPRRVRPVVRGRPRRPHRTGPARGPAGRRAARPARGRVLAKPPVRKLAKDLGMNLDEVAATGEGGVITRADVETHASGGAAPTASPPHRSPARPTARLEERDPDQGRPQDDRAGHGRLGVHRAARHRVHHRRRHQDDGARRERLKRDREFRDVKVTPLLVLAKALVPRHRAGTPA